MRPTLDDQSKRMLALREALSMSQTTFAARGGIDRLEVSKVERGKNKLSTARMRDAVAKAAGVSVELLALYLEGRLALDQLVATSTAPRDGRAA